MEFLQDSKADMDVCLAARAAEQIAADAIMDAWEEDRDQATDPPLNLEEAREVAAMIDRMAFSAAAIRLGYERLADSTPLDFRRCKCPEPGYDHRPWCGWVRFPQRPTPTAGEIGRRIDLYTIFGE